MQLGNHLDANSNRINNLGAPLSDSDAARLSDIKSAVEGIAWKDNCRVASQVNVTLSGPGASIDGITLTNGDRVLIRAQTLALENGVYIFNGSASPMTRAPDASSADELENAVTTIDEGTSAGSTYRQSAVNFVLGVNDVVFASFGTSAPDASETVKGIVELATQAELDGNTGAARAVTSDGLNGWSGKPKRFSQSIGDGAATAFNIDHNFNTRDVVAEVYRNSGNFDTVLCDITRPTVNRVTVTFSAAPGSNAYRVAVTG